MQVKKADDKRVELEPITEITQINNVVREKTIPVPGKEVITQPYVQQYFQQNDIYHVQNPYYERVPVTRNIPIPVPSLEKVPLIRRIPVYKPKQPAGTYTQKVNIRLPNRNQSTVSYEAEYQGKGNGSSEEGKRGGKGGEYEGKFGGQGFEGKFGG